jgi:hypothetical protein
MTSCDASILDDIPDEIGKLTGRIVRKWWATHGFPYIYRAFSYCTGGKDVFHLL